MKEYKNPSHQHASQRRTLIKSLVAAPLMVGLTGVPNRTHAANNSVPPNSRFKISLNAFSFNDPLLKGGITMDEMLQFCSDNNIQAVDITAYYFPGYPNVPEDSYLYELKRKAFRLGLEISGTGVRNDFTEPDPIKRKESVELVKRWIVAAEKFGAPVIRIFAGAQKLQMHTREQVLEWMLKDIRECVEFGKSHGVIVAIQNHDDFIKSAEEARQILNSIRHDWFGLILDTGSYRIYDPYEEIAKSIEFAVNWQIKEKVYIQGKEVDVDMDKLVGIIKASNYRGYLPVETLGAGDPKVKIPKLIEKLRKSLEQ